MAKGGQPDAKAVEDRVIYCCDPDKTQEEHPKYKVNYTSTTKYSMLSFFPKALFEQYRRVANIYFTIVAILSLTKYSPVNPVTTIGPLVLVIGVSLTKEAYEDYKRNKEDREVNSRIIDVFVDGERVQKRWQEVRVGDLVAVKRDNYFPADILLLHSTEEEGVCYIETANLDGETNLKVKRALQQTAGKSEAELVAFRGKVTCEPPGVDLYKFVGHLATEEVPVVPMEAHSLLLRDSSLRNTKEVIGVVVYCGHETRVMMNATEAPSKRSRVERQMDSVILFMFALLFAICFAGSLLFVLWTSSRGEDMWYLATDGDDVDGEWDPDSPWTAGATAFITSFVLYGYLIPISLYVSIETVKIVQSMVFITRDKKMYHAETDTWALARTSNLNEELGQIDTVLSDKTGTLTQNVMEFFKCSVAGVSYGEGVTEVERVTAQRLLGRKLSTKGPDAEARAYVERYFNFYDRRVMGQAWRQLPGAEAEQHEHFWRLLAICHTGIPEADDDSGEITYQVESPDEAAFITAAKAMGFKCTRRTATSVFVEERSAGGPGGAGGGTEVEYEILNILEFDSTRKRMSVVWRGPDGRIMVYCKGADTVIQPRLKAGGGDVHWEDTLEHMREYGEAGLRTLCLSYAELDAEFYDGWQERFVSAKSALQGRDAKLEAVSEEIERDLILLGSTAIEDKLQEGVPDAIALLARAGIRLWVLTGDKRETAINIGFACSLLRQGMHRHTVSIETPEWKAAEEAGDKERAREIAHTCVSSQLDAIVARAEGSAAAGEEHALIIDGHSLEVALGPEHKARLLAAGNACATVICCRVSPKQKADVTRLVKETGVTTLAIGDGANDVGMIQAADIGVGISGHEGRQAVMASDFAIAQFRYLERLVLVHGRWCYKRIGRMVSYFFYKNLLFGLTLFAMNTLTMFSGQIIYNDFTMSLYNVIFTVLPPLVVGVFDQDVSEASAFRFPRLYQAGLRGDYFSLRVVAAWLVNGLYQAVVICGCCVAFASSGGVDRGSGKVMELFHLGALAFTCVVITVNLQLALILEHWTWMHHISIWGSITVWYLFALVFGEFPADYATTIRKLFVNIVAPGGSYWLAIVVIPVAALLPDFFLRNLRRRLWPEDHHIVQEIEKLARAGEGGELQRFAGEESGRGGGSSGGGGGGSGSTTEIDLAEMHKRVRTLSKEAGTDGETHTGFSCPDTVAAESYFEPHAPHPPGGVSEARHGPVVNAMNKELEHNPYRHRGNAFKRGANALRAASKLMKTVGGAISDAVSGGGGDGGEDAEDTASSRSRGPSAPSSARVSLHENPMFSGSPEGPVHETPTMPRTLPPIDLDGGGGGGGGGGDGMTPEQRRLEGIFRSLDGVIGSSALAPGSSSSPANRHPRSYPLDGGGDGGR